jgi:hypothetical protein
MKLNSFLSTALIRHRCGAFFGAQAADADKACRANRKGHAEEGEAPFPHDGKDRYPGAEAMRTRQLRPRMQSVTTTSGT